jgi:enamine deaminase RidA (YjgF/YER057c/UK114 family)
MSCPIENRLAELGHVLPPAAIPAANYVPYVVVGKMLFISGQVPSKSGVFCFQGKVGDDISVETAQEAAELVALIILAQVKAAVGSLSQIKRCVRLGGFVNATPDFTAHPAVINGASNLMISAFGEAGRHARAAVGASGLPFGVAVEIEATFEIK